MFKPSQNHLSISNDEKLKGENTSPLQKMRTVICKTKPLAFQFLRSYKTPRSQGSTEKLHIPQSQTNTPSTQKQTDCLQ